MAGESDSEDEERMLSALLGKQKLKQGAEIASRSSRQKENKQKQGITGGGSFQSMGLPPALLKSLLMRGFTTPTPIQRLALPSALSSPPRDIVGMARTGSGKTLAYLIPLIARLGSTHSVTYGARALVLVPTRELALQVLKVGKDLARGINRKDKGEDGEALRWAMIVGGDGLEDQFGLMAANPDVIIATPGRLLHLIVEMSLSLTSVRYLVFDEADRLFELGFSTALTEIISKLPPSRQTLLFSATLPKSLVEFAKAGLENPKLVRLDSESKISKDLEMGFLSLKEKEKEAALLILLREIIKVPVTGRDAAMNFGNEDEGERSKKRKREHYKGGKKKKPNETTVDDDGAPATSLLSPHQTLIFVSTKHHVEYLSHLLRLSGYSTSAIYGSLDQSARRSQLAAFRSGRTNLLVVTDLAARGIDIPILENVVNYDFPKGGGRTFVHRVGRTARAGRKGWAYSFVTNNELPHLYDLQLFLGRPLLLSPLEAASSEPDYSSNLILGTLPRDLLDLELDHYQTVLLEPDATLQSLLGVAERGQKMVERSTSKASQESYRRVKELMATRPRGISGMEREEEGVHPLFTSLLASAAAHASTSALAGNGGGSAVTTSNSIKPSTLSSSGASRADLLARVNAFRPNETVFEVGKKGGSTAAGEVMMKRRLTMAKKKNNAALAAAAVAAASGEAAGGSDEDEDESFGVMGEAEVELGDDAFGGSDAEMADEDDLEAVFGQQSSSSASKAASAGPAAKKSKTSVGPGAIRAARTKGDTSAAKKDFRDMNVYMDYRQEGVDAERGYSLNTDTAGPNANTFTTGASSSAYDMTINDEDPSKSATQKASLLRWDRKHKKFVKGDGVGADNKKLIRTESGAKLPASYKSGTYDEWKKKQKVYLPKVGELELKDRQLPSSSHAGPGGKRFRHTGTSSSTGGGKPTRGGKGGVEKEFSSNKHKHGANGEGKKKGSGEKVKTKDLMGGKRAGAQLKSIDQIRKERAQKEKRVKRSNQPSKRRK